MANKSSGKHNKEQEKDFKEQLLEQPYIHRIMEWGTQNLKALSIAAGVIVLLIVMIFSWSAYQKGQNEKALVLEAEAFKAHQDAREQAASQLAESTDKETTEPEDYYKDAVAMYQEILDDYSGTKSAERALYLLGSIAYENGSYDQAQEYFSRYVSKHPKGTLVNSAQESLGYILEQQQSYQKAIDVFTELEKSVEGSQKTEIQLAIARNYEALDNDDDALAIYQEIIDSSTTAALKKQAKERLEIVQARQKIAASPAPPSTPSEEPETRNTPAAEEISAETPRSDPTVKADD